MCYTNHHFRVYSSHISFLHLGGNTDVKNLSLCIQRPSITKVHKLLFFQCSESFNKFISSSLLVFFVFQVNILMLSFRFPFHGEHNLILTIDHDNFCAQIFNNIVTTVYAQQQDQNCHQEKVSCRYCSIIRQPVKA